MIRKTFCLFSAANENLDSVPAVKIIAKGLWNCTVSRFTELGHMSTSNVKKGAEEIVVLISLDDVFADAPEENIRHSLNWI